MTGKEATAGGILGLLALMVATGWWLAPGESGNAVGTSSPAPHPPRGDATITYTAVTAPDYTGAVTATILAFMIVGAAGIGAIFFSPQTRRRPRRSGAVVVSSVARATYSSIAPGAVLETVIRNSMLLLVFFRRSTMRSMA
ncbi:hypothetical protein JMUB6875_11930 [Nocardia sp. JMUB6875]